MSNTEGFNELIAKLEKIGDAEKLQQCLEKACLVVERAAKEKCPSSTGELRSSISSSVEGTVGTVGSPLQYAAYVEYGTGLFASGGNGRTEVPWKYQDAKGEWHTTSGQPPQPFLIPALNENRQEILDILREGLKND